MRLDLTTIAKFAFPAMALIYLNWAMATLGLSDHLDMRLYYFPDEANIYLSNLTPEQSAHYLYRQFLDLMFIASYSTLFYFGAALGTNSRLMRGVALIPGLFDLLETAGILFSLKFGPDFGVTSWLGLATLGKWIAATLVVLLLSGKPISFALKKFLVSV